MYYSMEHRKDVATNKIDQYITIRLWEIYELVYYPSQFLINEKRLSLNYLAILLLEYLTLWYFYLIYLFINDLYHILQEDPILMKLPFILFLDIVSYG